MNTIHKLVEDNLALNQGYKKNFEVLLFSSSSSSVQKSEKSHTAMPASVSNKNKKHPKEILQMNEPLYYSEEKMAQGQKKLFEMRRKQAFRKLSIKILLFYIKFTRVVIHLLLFLSKIKRSYNMMVKI